MRFAVFVFSLLLVFVPTYSYAFIPFIAVRGLVAKTAKGTYQKIPFKREMLGAVGFSAISKFCKTNKTCKEIKDEIGDFLFDDENDVLREDWCNGKVGFQWATSPTGDRSVLFSKSYLDYANSFKSQLIASQKEHGNSVDPNFRLSGEEFDYYGTPAHFVDYDVIHSFFGYQYKASATILKVCVETQDNEEVKDKEQQKQEQIQKIINNLSDTEINTIINNYSTEIDIDKYCNESGSCDELSKEFGDEVTKNQNKYDIDKINKANCMVEKGVIVSCDNAKLDIDEEETEEGDSSDKEEDEPIDCKASEFHQKICDFIDWYQDDDFEPSEDDKIEARDLSDDLKLDKDRINFNGQCPPDKQFTMFATGHTVASSISYRPLCDFFIGIKPFLIGVSGIISVLIITGVRRG